VTELKTYCQRKLHEQEPFVIRIYSSNDSYIVLQNDQKLIQNFPQLFSSPEKFVLKHIQRKD
jgi:hypothetical protein